MGLNEADLQGLARLLIGFGVVLSVSEDGAPPHPLAGLPTASLDPGAQLRLSDGRRLQVASTGVRPAAVPSAGNVLPLERRAGPEADHLLGRRQRRGHEVAHQAVELGLQQR